MITAATSVSVGSERPGGKAGLPDPHERGRFAITHTALGLIDHDDAVDEVVIPPLRVKG